MYIINTFIFISYH